MNFYDFITNLHKCCIKVSGFSSSFCLALRNNSTDFEQDAHLLRAVEDCNEDIDLICAS
jgi:hypothetical protein